MFFVFAASILQSSNRIIANVKASCVRTWELLSSMSAIFNIFPLSVDSLLLFVSSIFFLLELSFISTTLGILKFHNLVVVVQCRWGPKSFGSLEDSLV